VTSDASRPLNASMAGAETCFVSGWCLAQMAQPHARSARSRIGRRWSRSPRRPCSRGRASTMPRLRSPQDPGGRQRRTASTSSCTRSAPTSAGWSAWTSSASATPRGSPRPPARPAGTRSTQRTRAASRPQQAGGASRTLGRKDRPFGCPPQDVRPMAPWQGSKPVVWPTNQMMSATRPKPDPSCNRLTASAASVKG
jgi:hypothetical protein